MRAGSGDRVGLLDDDAARLQGVHRNDRAAAQPAASWPSIHPRRLDHLQQRREDARRLQLEQVRQR